MTITKLDFQKNLLDNAQKQGLKKGLYDFPIVDGDCHHFGTPLAELAAFVEEPWKSRLIAGTKGAKFTFFPQDIGDRTMGGRSRVKEFFNNARQSGMDLPKDIYPLVEHQHKMAIDYSVVFPTDMLTLGLHPQAFFESSLAFAYARWMTEKVLPKDDSLLTMLLLPLSDPDACIEIVKEFGHKKGVVGFMITSVRNHPIHDNRYMPLYKIIEETGKPISFHTVSFWLDRPFQQLNNFISAHALGFPLYNMIQMANLVTNGIPERFPDIKFFFIEAGVTWIPFMMGRLDADYMMRTSEAPSLTKKPSKYIKNFYFSTQPLEHFDNPEHLKTIFEMFDAESQLVYTSDYPHQDFDAPSIIYDLPFLDEKTKRKILGENALRLFGIEKPELFARRILNEKPVTN